jgi:tRNA (cytidine32/uridine32-2'-O)-methyltransferase
MTNEITRKPISENEANNRATKTPTDLDNIRVVLVRTFHSGNIGSAARAMKTMGLTNLVLVSPTDFQLDQALQMAMSADDVVTNAKHVDSLYDAVADCGVVIGSTARSRGYDLPMQSPEQAAQSLLLNAKQQPVALVFGPERMGLHNDDLEHCTHRATIPTNPDYSSLNLAAAVQTLSYEVFKQFSQATEDSENNITEDVTSDDDKKEMPTIKDNERFYQHLEEALVDVGFIFKKHPGEVMKKLRSMFSRTQMNQTEMGIMRGILASMQKPK